jgi:hypothetical protein
VIIDLREGKSLGYLQKEGWTSGLYINANMGNLERSKNLRSADYFYLSMPRGKFVGAKKWKDC